MLTNDRFREALELDFSNMEISSRAELSTLMRIAGYRRKYNKTKKKTIKRFPTEKQLDAAWRHLKRGQLTLDTEEFFKTEKYEKHFVSRAQKDVYVKGKLYRKGQFLPHGKKKKK